MPPIAIAFLTALFFFSLSFDNTGLQAQTTVEFGGKGSASGQFGKGIKLTVGKDGRIYVSDVTQNRLQIYDQTGQLIRVLNASGQSYFEPEKLGEIAVNKNNMLWVADWKSVRLSEKEPIVYFYTPIIHRFRSDGTYLGFVVIDSVKISDYPESNLTPVVDRSGKAAWGIRTKDYDRPFHLTDLPNGDFCLVDELKRKIYRYSEDGNRKLVFNSTGKFDRPVSVASDKDGNIYVADQGNHRIVKFNANGQPVGSFGNKGYGNGEFISPCLVSVIRDEIVLVKDETSFDKTFESYLELSKTDPSPKLSLNEDEIDLKDEDKKRHGMRFERIQKFGLDGKYKGKILLRFSLHSPSETIPKLLAIDDRENIYLFNLQNHKVKILPRYKTGFDWNKVQKTYNLIVQKTVNYRDRDKSADLDKQFDDLYKGNFRSLLQSFLLKYDVTEKTAVSVEGKITLLGAFRQDLFPGEKLPEEVPESRFINDYFFIDDRIEGDIRFGFEIILDQDPYKYRKFTCNLQTGGAKHHFRYGAFALSNQAFAKQDLWQWDAGFDMTWDIRRDVNCFWGVSVASPSQFMNYKYKYVDQSGILLSTASMKSITKTIYTGFNVAF